MSAVPAPAANDAAAGPPTWQETLLRSQIARLDELVDAELALAKDIQRRSGALEPGDMVPPISLGNASLAMSHVSRAMRLTISLQDRLAGRLTALERNPLANAWPGTGGSAQPGPSAHHLDRDPVREREHRVREAADSADDDHFDEILERPFDEVIAVICTALNIEPNWDADRLGRAVEAVRALVRSNGSSARAPTTGPPSSPSLPHDPAPAESLPFSGSSP